MISIFKPVYSMKKVILLSTVILLVLGALLYFVKTRLDPPMNIVSDRQYQEMAQACIDEINPKASMEDLNMRFFKAGHMVVYMADSLLLSSEDADNLKEGLCKKYIPAFTDKCFEYFRKSSVWDSTVINTIRQQVGVVKLIHLSSGKRVVDNGSRLNDAIDSVFFVTKRNEEALRLLKNRTFHSMEQSEQTMAKVKIYQNHDYLQYNTSLCDSLDMVARRLEKSHYDALDRRVTSLRYPDDIEEDEFGEIYQKLMDDIQEYEENASRVYGYVREVRDLKEAANDNYHIGKNVIQTRNSGWHFDLIF